MTRWQRFLCNVLGWHTVNQRNWGNRPVGGMTGLHWDGASWIARCTRCGRRCAEDSQGNWFALSGS